MSDVDDAIIELLVAVTRAPSALKAWRGPVSDLFYDSRFFGSPPQASRKWKPIVHALVTSDKERFLELIGSFSSSLVTSSVCVGKLNATPPIGKVSAASSANIFTNREHEMQTRALSLRRLTYAILAGENNRYLTQLPSIQEKVVDLLRANVGEVVHSEVCLPLSTAFGWGSMTDGLAGLWATGVFVSTRLAMPDRQSTSIDVLACHSHRTGVYPHIEHIGLFCFSDVVVGALPSCAYLRR
jgi:hypothetical protein